MTLEQQLCHCFGNDPNCADCNGTGTVDRAADVVRGSPWMVNVFVPDGLPYYACHPSSHVRCRFCGRRINRRKIWKHVREAHPNAVLGPLPECGNEEQDD